MKYLALVLAFLCVSAPAMADKASNYTHSEYFENYEGTVTCLECHGDEAEAFFHSQHYQWRGDAPGIVNANGEKLGKMNTMNDFCTNPLANWIGKSFNSEGKVLSEGCSKCHAGLGKQPEETVSREQLENIDCLICHASGYRRGLYETADGGWEWRPILWKNPVGLNSVSKRISLPKRAMCLRCHAGAGGGQNYKRGDIEYALADCDESFDVHMAKTGNDMQCIDCHAGEDHRVRGRGADLSGTDLPDRPLSCSGGECHDAAPHADAVLNRHAERVFCTVCHIPEFAKSDPTDMVRDWSTPFHVEEGNKFTATITMEKNVTPVYTWFDGRTRLQKMGEPVERRADGSVAIMAPTASRQTPGAKIYAFKLHRAVLPLLKDKEWIIPLAVEEFFADGDIDRAVRRAAQVVYGIDDADYTWIKSVRYMGLFHEVQPSANALKCLDCHGESGRMDWQALGYEENPVDPATLE